MSIARERALQALEELATERADELFLSGAGLCTNLSPSSVAALMYDHVASHMQRTAKNKLAMKAMLDAAIEHALAACRKDAQKIADVALNSMSS